MEVAEERFLGQFANATKALSTWLNDKETLEIMCNEGTIFVDMLGKEIEKVPITLSDVDTLRIISLVASHSQTTITSDNPIVSAELPDGSRFEGLISPVVKKPSFSIRKHLSKVLTLENYLESGIIDEKTKEIIEDSIRERHNIVVVGSTGSGKTTFCNAIVDGIARLTPAHRVISIEDTRELKINSEDSLCLRTSDTVDMTRLLKSCMRLRPDRILVGEVRDASALALLKAWNTGHPGGVATVHANSALSGLIRLEQLVQEANIPLSVVKPLIAEAVNVVIFMEKTKTSRKVKEIIKVTGFDSKNFEYTYDKIL